MAVVAETQVTARGWDLWREMVVLVLHRIILTQVKAMGTWTRLAVVAKTQATVSEGNSWRGMVVLVLDRIISESPMAADLSSESVAAAKLLFSLSFFSSQCFL